MAIIISKNGTNAQKINETHFGLEDKLQEHVKNNPDIIPIYEINEDAKLLVLAREFSTNSGPIDALGVDQDGNVYVIETKLYRNPDKRTVLAQALDYGASLWMHSGDTLNFIEQLDREVSKQFGMNLLEKIEDFFGNEEPQLTVDTIARNVAKGNIKFVILMDTVQDRLKDLITYVNQNSRFDVYAVDLEYYKHDEFEIVIPKLYGAEVKKDVANYDDGTRFDNQKIINWIQEINADYLTIDRQNTTKTYIRFTTNFLDSILPPREDTNSGWKNGNAYYYEIRTDKSGWVKIYLVLNGNGTNQQQVATQKRIIDASGRSIKKEDWQWFVVQNWKVDYQGSEQNLHNEITRVISTEIPAFELEMQKLLQP